MKDLDELVFLPGSIGVDERSLEQEIALYLEKKLNESGDVGYFGYKWTTLNLVDEEAVPTFLFVSHKLGILVVDVITEKVSSIEEGGDHWVIGEKKVTSRDLVVDVYRKDSILGRLSNDRTLFKRRELDVKINTILYFADNTEDEIKSLDPNEEFIFSDYVCNEDGMEGLAQRILELTSGDTLEEERFSRVLSLLDGTFILKSKISETVDEDSIKVNDLILKSLNKTFTQDKSQKLISGQIPQGPQRIRGLAGTGKTVVLSLKAAITHRRKPEFKILFLFNTRSLYKQITDLITKYYVSEAKKQPDFEQSIKILHAWGGREQEGLYSSLCDDLGIRRLTFNDVRGQGDALGAIYRDLLKNGQGRILPTYDMVLIDEAQDFPDEVFEVAFLLAKEPKRIVWAYDEFQSLNDMFIKSPENLFGLNSEGEPNIPSSSLVGEYPGPVKKDFILPNSYRNPRINLMIAHGVALCLYADRVAPLYKDPLSWNALGYEVQAPMKSEFQEGDAVVLSRPSISSKNDLEKIVGESFRSREEVINQLFTMAAPFINTVTQIDYIVDCIQQLIVEESVPPEEIIVIDLDTSTAKSDFVSLRHKLAAVDINATTPGFIESAHVFKKPNSVTLTTPFRAKGNEANIVFIMNCHRVTSGIGLKFRNSFFVSVTRSRGWVYASGIGKGMEKLAEEISSIKRDYPRFKFTFPSDESMGRARELIDVNVSDKTVKSAEKLLEEFKDSPEVLVELLEQYPELKQRILEL